MARSVRKTSLETRTARLKLPVARKPVFIRIGPGLSHGYRRNQVAGTWVLRLANVQRDAAPTLHAAAEEAQRLAADMAFPDERLQLMFICAHPAIDPAARTPLMLQTVLGLNAARITSAFLVQPAAMGQRLTCAKTKIRDARIAFELPEAKELAPRLDAVLEAIYAAYGSGWDDVAGADPRRKAIGRGKRST